MSRRVLLIIALLVVVGGVAAALVLSRGGAATPAAAATQAGNSVAQQATIAPTAGPTSTPQPTALPTIDIVVALQRINRGQTISADVIGFRTWPEPYAPLSAITDPELVIGSIARFDIERESPIKTSDITDNLSNLGATGSDAAAVMPAGTRLIAVPIDRLTSIGYAMQPGDRVDIIISLLYVDLDEEFQSMLPNDLSIISVTQDPDTGSFSFAILAPVDGRPDTLPTSLGSLGAISLPIIVRPSEDPRPRLVTQMTIQDALVVNMGDFPPNGRLFRASSAASPVAAPAPTTNTGAAATATPIPRPDLVAIAVSPQEAVVLTYLIESKVPVTFVLRPATETGLASVQQVDLDFLMNQYRITVPRKLPFGIEPAIRTIRQLLATDTIQLRPAAAAAPASTGR
jgi:Flp pilus assembly protein CpaB